MTQTDEYEKFEKISEPRNDYYCEYAPPAPGHKFSVLQVVVLAEQSTVEVDKAVASEVEHWLSRFNYPMMITVFDSTEKIIEIPLFGGAKHLLAWSDTVTGVNRTSADLSDADFENAVENSFPKRFEVFGGLKFETVADRQLRIHTELDHSKKRMTWFKLLLLLWFLVVPTVWLIATSFGPTWLAVLATAYSLFQIVNYSSILFGWRKPSSRKIKVRNEETQMKHHHLHCKMNPAGFERLKSENFMREVEATNIAKHKAMKDRSHQPTTDK
jgi:hypothetical protein